MFCARCRCCCTEFSNGFDGISEIGEGELGGSDGAGVIVCVVSDGLDYAVLANGEGSGVLCAFTSGLSTIGCVVDGAACVGSDGHFLRLGECTAIRCDDRLSNRYSAAAAGSKELDGSDVQAAVVFGGVGEVDGQPVVRINRPLCEGFGGGHELFAACFARRNLRRENNLVDNVGIVHVACYGQGQAIDSDC